MKRRKKILKNTNRPVKKIITSDSNKGANNPSKVYRTIVTMIETPDAARPKGFAVSPSARFLTGGKKCRRAKKVPVTRLWEGRRKLRVPPTTPSHLKRFR